jgi:tetratricopeptide (TPR) repeat protein
MYISGDIERSLALFSEIYNKDPHFLNNAFMLGKTHFFGRNPGEAERIWKTVLEENPEHIDTVKWLSRLYLQKGQADKAELILTRALSISSEDPFLLLLLAQTRRQQKDLETAIELYNKTQMYREHFAQAYLDKAEIYMAFGLPHLAQDELEAALLLLGPHSSLYNAVKTILENITQEVKP